MSIRSDFFPWCLQYFFFTYSVCAERVKKNHVYDFIVNLFSDDEILKTKRIRVLNKLRCNSMQTSSLSREKFNWFEVPEEANLSELLYFYPPVSDCVFKAEWKSLALIRAKAIVLSVSCSSFSSSSSISWPQLFSQDWFQILHWDFRLYSLNRIKCNYRSGIDIGLDEGGRDSLGYTFMHKHANSW